MCKHCTQSAFSLVELSIVLVILGLLVGGILTGQNLIRAAELRSVTTQIDAYRSAIYSFRNKYMELPGDMTNAATFWTQAPDCSAQTASGKATCNGNGDGRITWSGANPERAEMFTVWQHLSNAGLINGFYDGVRGPGTYSASSVSGQNTPASKISNACVNFIYSSSALTVSFSGGDHNMFTLGTVSNGDYCYGGVLTPEEAWNIDTKTDDGKPGTGAVKSWLPNRRPNCADGSTIAANYSLQQSAKTCSLTFDFR